MVVRWITAAWLLMLLTVCPTGARAQEQSQSAPSDLSGPTWQLVQFHGSDGSTLLPADRSKYTIAFEVDGTVAVRVDCNRGHGAWKSAQHRQLEFSPLALTRMACPPGPLNDRLPKDWQNVRSYTIKDGHLFLALADSGIYEFEPQSPHGKAASGASAPFLEDTYWKLTRLGDTAVTMASKQQEEPHFILNSQLRRVIGSGGCNRITGSYDLNGRRLVFSQMAGTMMACLAGMETETAFLRALNRVATWKITEQKLELYDDSGNAIASFEAQHMR
jgi:heat shock protein HslJ